MAIKRVKVDNGYTIMNNEAFKDDRLSAKSKGLMAYMLTLPDDWTFYETELQKHFTDGRDSIRKGLRELQDAGYLVKEQTRKNDGKFSSADWLLYETAQVADIPLTENQSTEKPSSGNPPLLSTNSTKDLSKQITNSTNIKPSQQVATDNLKERFDTIWKEYPLKKGKPKAFEYYKKAIKSGTTDAEIADGISAYRAEIAYRKTKPEYIAHGSTWFNQKRWADDYEKNNNKQEAFAGVDYNADNQTGLDY